MVKRGEVNTHISLKTVFAGCRMMANNINKNASTEILQPGWEAGLKLSEKSSFSLIPAFRTCERATLERRKGHSCSATVALFQARSGPFRLVSGHSYVSVKFKRLIISILKTSSKSLICAEQVVGCKYRNMRGRKRINSLTVVVRISPPPSTDCPLVCLREGRHA